MIELVYHEPTPKEYEMMVRNQFLTPLTDGQVLILKHLDVFENGRLQGIEPGDVMEVILENWDGIFSKENAQKFLSDNKIG